MTDAVTIALIASLSSTAAAVIGALNLRNTTSIGSKVDGQHDAAMKEITAMRKELAGLKDDKPSLDSR